MFSKFFINHPRFALVLSILFLLGGGIAIAFLPVAQYPDIAPSLIEITTSYPGADAKTVQETVIQPIEAEVNGVKRMLYMKSTATDTGSAVIDVTCDIGTDGDLNTVNVQNRVNWADSSLPSEVKQQGVIVKEKSSNMLLCIALVSPDNRYSSMYMSNFLNIYIKDELARIPGVADVSIFGELKYSMRIWLDPEKLAALEMTVDDVTAAIQAQNIQVSSGAVGDSPVSPEIPLRLSISTKGRLETPEEFEDIVIRAESDGSQVKIRNVGRVELGAENYSSRTQIDNHDGAMLAVYQLNSANGLEISEKILSKLDEIKETLFPEGLEYRIQYDTTAFIRASVREVVETLIIAVLLVILVTYLFLQDWRATLVPTLAIPVSLVGTFAFMYLMNFSINLVTLFGLILAIGIVVDDAIVVIENISRLMEREKLSARDAAIKSMEQVTGPVIATTAVLLAMFVPICFMGGITGVMYRQFGITISVSVVISSINALTLSPAVSALILKPADASKRGFFIFRLFNAGFEKITAGYARIVHSLVRKLALLALLYLGATASIYFIYRTLPTGFVPDEDQGAFFVNIQLPDASSLARTQAVAREAVDIVKKVRGVSTVASVSGYSIITGVSASNSAFLIARLEDWEKRKGPGEDQFSILKRLSADLSHIPGAAAVPFGTPSIPGIGSTGGFSFVIQDRTGTDPHRLQEAVDGIVAEANRSPLLSGVFSTFSANLPQIFLEIDREKVLKTGVTLDGVNNALKGLFGSSYVNDFNRFGKNFKVKVQAESSARDTMDDIPDVYVRNSSGEMVPLGTFVEMRTKYVPQYLSRYNMYSSVTVTGNPASAVSSGEAMAEMERIAKKVLPAGMTYEWTDMSYQEKLSAGKTGVIFALALVFIYLFLVAQYESWLIPVAVLLSVPIAFLGALFSLFLLGITNNIYTQVGFVLLFGIACKTAILIVEFAKSRHESGAPILESAESAAKLRFRSVLMTAVSFLLGTLPLVIATGACSVSRRSLGTAVFGGMLVSVVLGTMLIPAFYAMVQRVIDKKFGKEP